MSTPQTIAADLLQAAIARAAELRNLPESTYRLQLHKDFTFGDASRIVPYLAKLGITHVYCSPYLKARPNSSHGYDVIDHCSLNPELGSQADFDHFLSTLKQHRLSHILDTVPNHVGVFTHQNVWWNDVLKFGPRSRFASYFDITWDSSSLRNLRNKILLPLLGEPYSEALESGKLRLCLEDNELWLCYYERRFPISPETTPKDLSLENLAGLNGHPGDPGSFDALDELIIRQHYRLAWWRVAPDEINYRRFFDCNDLAALAMERQEVFDATQLFTLSLCAAGYCTGLRIDHPDGLYDPAQYLQRLQSHYLLGIAEQLHNNSQTWPAIRDQLLPLIPHSQSLYIVVEKILASNEPLPSDWPVAGTSGYDPLNEINGLFIDPAGKIPLSQIHNDFTGSHTDLPDLIYQKKLLILDISLSSELHMLAHQIHGIAQSDRHSRDFTFRGLFDALRHTIACFAVYRTYTTDAGPRPADRSIVEAAIECAIQRNPKLHPSVFHYLRNTLLLTNADHLDPSERHTLLRFAGKFQQLTAPVTAKGIEDTAFYCYHRLISLNEVGGDPDRFGIPPAELHAYLAHRAQHHAHALTPLSTHDTKRSEDVRARLNVLSEIPDEWRTRVQTWRTLNDPHKRNQSPASDEEYLLYQTLLGVWPIKNDDPATFLQRIQSYMRKALREAKLRSSWSDPNEEHESAVMDFIAAILDPVKSQAFLADFLPFQNRIAHQGLLNSLSQTLLRLTSPGVPDTYQGTELLDLSLVDPDNRRPVDYLRRAKMLASVSSSPTDPDSLKLLLTTTALRARRSRPGLFTTGSYTPLYAAGKYANHLFSFLRQHKGATALVAFPRLITPFPSDPIADVWADTTLSIPPGLPPLRNLFTNDLLTFSAGTLSASTLFKQFPFALLLSE